MLARLFNKYIPLAIVYLLAERYLGYYGFRLYYTLVNDPKEFPFTVQEFESVLIVILAIFRIVMIAMMSSDLKDKKIQDWLILIVTFFSIDLGIPLFMVWVFYKETKSN